VYYRTRLRPLRVEVRVGLRANLHAGFQVSETARESEQSAVAYPGEADASASVLPRAPLISQVGCDPFRVLQDEGDRSIDFRQ
jgi:hypothetical protein